MFAQDGFSITVVNVLWFLAPLLISIAFVLVLFSPSYRWRILTYRRAGILLLFCIACEAVVGSVSAYRSIRYSLIDVPVDLNLDHVTFWMNWIQVPFALFSASFLYVSGAALLLLFLRDRGIDIAENWGSGRKGLDPYN